MHILTLALVGLTSASWAPKHLQKHFNCPFAKVWLEHGPEKASDILGMPAHKDVSDEPQLPRCTLAEGFAAGAHQHANSVGYDTNCSGSPGQESPYMFPMHFGFHGEETTLPYDTNVPTLVKKTQKWYNFKKMLKRSDSIDAVPRTPNDLTTVLHRHSMMWIMYWKDGADFRNVSQVKYCMYIDMGNIGLMRPDFFLDARPYDAKDIQTQYLGKQHLYHYGKPRLVKQWRKRDFVNTTFTISIDEHASDDRIHYPLMMNIPGELAGPDVINQLHRHKILSEEDEHVYYLDEEYIANGGVCHNPFNQTSYVCKVCLHKYDTLNDGDGVDFEELPDSWICPVCGAPKSSYEKKGTDYVVAVDALGSAKPPSPIPSALELDVNAWRDIEYTFSPYWEPGSRPDPQPTVYMCDVCAHEYNADTDGAGAAFEDLPDDWVCPVCSQPKSHYHPKDSVAMI
jgi:rubredoxin